MTTAAIYVRISADRTGEGLGVERQEAECRALAARLGFDVSEVYSDNDLSATTGKVRPAFERLLADAPSVVIAWHTDRLVRKSRDLERVLDLGLTVHAVTAGHIDLSTPAGRAVARTVTAWATYEGEQRTARQLAETKQRAERGVPAWTHRPFGYNRDGTPHPAEGPAVVQAYRDALEGKSHHAIARDWQQLREAKVYPTTVSQVLTSPRNAGIRTHRGAEVAKGNWTPLVDEATFRAYIASREGKAHSKSRARKYLLSGLGLCGRCDATLHATGMGYGRAGEARRIYQCSTTPGHFTRNLAPVDATVTNFTVLILSLPGARGVLTEHDGPDVDALRAERATLEHRRDVELPAGLAAGLSVAQVAAASGIVNARIAEIDATLTDTARADLFGDVWANMATAEGLPVDRFNALELHRKQAILRALWTVIRPEAGRNAGVSLEPTEATHRIIAASLPYAADVAAALGL